MAIDSAKKALTIYSHKKNQNTYGMALQQFQLGHLYEQHGLVLSSPDFLKHKPNTSLIENEANVQFWNDLAVEMYINAFDCFRKIDHTRGMYLCKLH